MPDNCLQVRLCIKNVHLFKQFNYTKGKNIVCGNLYIKKNIKEQIIILFAYTPVLINFDANLAYL